MAVNRGQFGSRIGFVLAAAGSAVGLGNIWKFPFEVGQGGGAAFVLMYLTFCFLLCFPVMVAEIAIGRRTNRNAVGAFKALGHKNWAIVGILGVIAGVLILSFYNVVAGWAFGYFLEMVVGNFDIGNQFGEFITDVFKVGAYGLVFMAITAWIVSGGIQHGIEKAAKILMPTLFLMIVGLMIYALTLNNAWEGIEFYLVPDFGAINGTVVYSALGQAFFSLSLGMGALITYGSYVSKDQDIIGSAAMITFVDVGIAFLAGLMIFPFVFYSGIEPSGGAGLIFATLPGIFESIGPVLGVVIGSAFFLLLSFAALTSTVSLLEVPVSYVVDEHNVPRKKAVWGIAMLIFVIGIPSLIGNGYSAFFTNFVTLPGMDSPLTFMDLIEDLASDSFLPVGGFLISLFAAYVWRKQNLREEIALGREGKANGPLVRYTDFAIGTICPVILGTIALVTILDRFFGINLVTQIFGAS